MVINLRGTSGAGKSTIVTEVMKRYEFKQPLSASDVLTAVPALEVKETRRQPLGYRLHNQNRRALWIPGHYEIACGGCDTIQKVDDVYKTISWFAGLGCDVLFEGIMVQDDVRRAIDLAQHHRLLVIALTTPIDECLKAIQSRRDARGDTRPLDPKNTKARAHRLKTSMLPRLKAAGVEVLELDRDAALKTVLERLGL
jgi:hypothetical protein